MKMHKLNIHSHVDINVHNNIVDDHENVNDGEVEDDEQEDLHDEVDERDFEGCLDVAQQRTIVEHYEYLQAEGSFDPRHVLQYMMWGKRKITNPSKIAVFMFLRAVYGGTGASRRQAQGMLDFLHQE